jgi:aspartate carbamoyltransferase regulatory subunit
LGSKKLKLLEHFNTKPSFGDIISIDGFSDISAKSFLSSYDEFYDFIEDLPITIKEKTITNKNLENIQRATLSNFLFSHGKIVSTSTDVQPKDSSKTRCKYCYTVSSDTNTNIFCSRRRTKK